MGGTIVSVHSPFQAEAWLDKHKHKPVIKAIHSAANARGPVAAMIHPRLPGLSIFGSVDDPDHHAHAKRLADVSGFVVILRPLADYPLEIPAQSNTSFDSIEGLPSTYGDLAEGASSKIGKALRLRGGASSSSDDESDDGVYWRSHVHSSTIRATLVDDDCHHPIRITSAYSFKKQSEYGTLSHTDATPLTRPQIVGIVTLDVKTEDKNILSDRSYINVGFVAHREKSIRNHQFYACVYQKLEFMSKRSHKKGAQQQAGGTVGLAGGKPTALFAGHLLRTSGKTMEEADIKVAARWRVDNRMGPEWDSGSQSFASYNATITPRADEMDTDHHPLTAKFAMGVNVFPRNGEEEESIPDLSFITRNQIFVWVLKPTLRSIIILTSTYIPDIQAEQRLFINETPVLNIEADCDPTFDQGVAAHDAGIFVAAASFDRSKTTKSKLFDRALANIRQLGKSRFSKQHSPSLATVQLYNEYVARGWDATNETWRKVEWPPVWDEGYLPLTWCSDGPAPDNDNVSSEPAVSFRTALSREEDEDEEGGF